MSDRVEGSAPGRVTTVPRPADSPEGPTPPGMPPPRPPVAAALATSRSGALRLPTQVGPTPVTAVSVTSAPVTAVPITPVSPTPRPVTAVPVASVPMTSVPMTPVPVTSVPMTSVPMTPVPVTPVQAAGRLPQPKPTSRANVRGELDAALAGAPLSTRDRQFLSKLVHWDKRNAASVVSLLRRARRAGRNEAALTPVQLETVLAALEDAVVHRVAGVDAVGCWDCENVRGGRCAEHSRDFERARDYADLAALLSAGLATGAPRLADEPLSAGVAPTPIQRPTDISGYRRRTPIVS
jgi:hypothetical protein